MHVNQRYTTIINLYLLNRTWIVKKVSENGNKIESYMSDFKCFVFVGLTLSDLLF